MKQILTFLIFTSLVLVNAASAIDSDRHSPADGKTGSASGSSSEPAVLSDYYPELRDDLYSEEIHDISTANELVRSMYRQATTLGSKVLELKSKSIVGEAQQCLDGKLQFRKRKDGSCKYSAKLTPSDLDPRSLHEGSFLLGETKLEGFLQNHEQSFKIENKMGFTTGRVKWATGPDAKVQGYSYLHSFPRGLQYEEQSDSNGVKIKWVFKDGSIKTGLVKRDKTFDFKIAYPDGSVLTSLRDPSGLEKWKFTSADGLVKTGRSQDGTMIEQEEVGPGGVIIKKKYSASGKVTEKTTVLSPEGKLEKTKHTSTECDHCRKESTDSTFKKCSGCQLFRYCSRECQAADWKAHKSFCKAKQAEAAAQNRVAGSTRAQQD